MESLKRKLFHLPDDFNSDDEVDQGPEENPLEVKAGKRVVASIFQNAAENRVSSKQAYRNQKLVARAPGSQVCHDRWTAMFTAHQMTLGVSLETTPTGEHIYRFIDTITKELKPHCARGSEKLVPSESTILTGLRFLETSLVFKFPNFALTRSDKIRNTSLLNRLVKEERLVRGVWAERQWVGYTVLLRLSRSWMRKGINEGVHSWDVHISRLLSVLLISACCSRAGDITRSVLYKGMECLKWRDVCVFLPKDGNSLNSIRVAVTIEYEKGAKDIRNKNRIAYLDMLETGESNPVCPVKTLLGFAMRVGATTALNASQLLQQIKTRRDRKLHWTDAFRERPVIAAIFHCAARGRLDFKKPAGIHQVQRSLAQIGDAAGSLERLRTHSLRRGALRDIAHLPNDIRGHATVTVALAAGQSVSTFNNGVTQEYVGGSDLATFSQRAQSAYDDPRAPEIAHQPFRRQRNKLKPQDITEYIKANIPGGDVSDARVRQRVSLILRHQEFKVWQDTVKGELVDAVDTVHSTRTEHSADPDADKRADINSDQPSMDLRIAQLAKNDLSHQSCRPEYDDPIERADPYFDLPADGDTDEQGTQLLDYCLDIFSGHGSGDPDSDEQQAESLFLDSLEALSLETTQGNSKLLVESNSILAKSDSILAESDSILAASDEEYINFIASVNIFLVSTGKLQIRRRKGNMEEQDDGEEDLSNHVASGNSRDQPTPFARKCPYHTTGCTYVSYDQTCFDSHAFTCKFQDPNYVAPVAAYPCKVEGCDRTFLTAATRRAHVRDDHKAYEPHTCEYGCTDGKIFESRGGYKNHLNQVHNPQTWTCPVEGCALSAKLWDRRAPLVQHLKFQHKWTKAQTDEIESEKKPKDGWVRV